MILNKSVTACDGEVTVKTYQCSYFNSILLGFKADGFVEVTNKRLLFQAIGKGSSKKSIIHSEVPLPEVVGINIYKGQGFNIFRLLLGIIILSLITFIGGIILDTLFSSMSDSPTLFQFIVWGLALVMTYLAYQTQKPSSTGHTEKDQSWLEILYYGLALGFLSPVLKSIGSFYQSYGSAKPAAVAALVLFIYALIKFAKKPAFSLSIHSRSGSETIVKITGTSPMGAGNKSAIKSLTAKPGPDSDLVLKELGAVVSDIQNLGDYGLAKWTVSN